MNPLYRKVQKASARTGLPAYAIWRMAGLNGGSLPTFYKYGGGRKFQTKAQKRAHRLLDTLLESYEEPSPPIGILARIFS